MITSTNTTKQMEHVYYAKLVNFERHLQQQHQRKQQLNHNNHLNHQHRNSSHLMATPEDTNIEIVVERKKNNIHFVNNQNVHRQHSNNDQIKQQHAHYYIRQNNNKNVEKDEKTYLSARIHNLNSAIGSSTLLYDNNDPDSDFNDDQEEEEEEERQDEQHDDDEELNAYNCKGSGSGRINATKFEHILIDDDEEYDDCDENKLYKRANNKFMTLKATLNRKSNKINPILIEANENGAKKATSTTTTTTATNNLVFSSSSLSSLSCSNNSIDNCLSSGQEQTKKLNTNKSNIAASSSSSSSSSSASSLSPLENAMRIKLANEKAMMMVNSVTNGVSNEFYGNSLHMPVLLKKSLNTNNVATSSAASSSSPTSSSSSSSYSKSSSTSSSSSSSSQRIFDKENDKIYSNYSLVRTQVMRTKSIAAEHNVMHHSLHSFPITHARTPIDHGHEEEDEEEEENDHEDEEEEEEEANAVSTTDQIDKFNLRLNRFVNKKGGNLGKFMNVIFLLF
jgi:hypothetical protein